ncbi:MAG TPA: RnfABCDGE type electron transport complex subunit G, partial [Candidatus Onthenecus intestinigallinarum]|nr:RnfABCDGE type electron transport complex subunit G [Candidatus Onthenecus intestinigallinarum]
MRDVTKLGLRLFIFTLIAALALAVTNEITSGPIAQQELAAGQAAQRAVLPEAEIFETQEIQTAPEYDQITELYVGKTGDEVVGYVMTASPQGYGGPIPITLGIGADGSIHGVSVGDLQETAGLGSKVGEEPFTSQFPGLAADPAEIDANVQTISGATISSQAFVTAVRQMTAYSKDVLGVVPNAAVPTLEGDDLVRKEFVDAAEAFEALDVMSLLGDYETIQSVYTGTVGDDAVGYVFELSSKGFADQIGLRMGITTDGVISKVVMTANNETPDYGTKTTDPAFCGQFDGNAATVEGYMEGVDVMSGATVSSNAVFKAVGQAVDFYNQYLVPKPEEAGAGNVYEVTGFQPMKVEITVEDGKITSFAVTEHNETPGYGADVIAAGFDSLIGQDIATAQFDVVSGVTMTSNAINEALKQAAEATGTGAEESVPVSAEAETETASGNVYEVTGFQPMKVEITVEDGKITSFAVTEHNETPSYGADVIAAGFDSLIGQDIATAEFDVVSGATMTCNAINDALAQAAAAAGTGAEAVASTGSSSGVYEVTGFQPMKVEIAVEDGKIASFAVTEHNETAGFGADLIAEGFDSLIGQDIATAEFDVVSGVTLTSNAINDALAQAAAAAGTGAEESVPASTEAEPETVADGNVYEVTGFQPMKVEVVVEDGKIASVAVTEHNETAGFGADVIAAGFDSLI